MPKTLRILHYLVICFALVVSSWTNTSLGQEDEIQTSAPAASVDPSFLFSGEAPTTIEQLKFMERRFAEISEKVKAATVNIQIEGSQGSGVLVSSDGYILTAAHVIGQPNRTAFVNFIDESGNEKRYKAETLGVERRLDSGMLKIKNAEGEEFPYLNIAISEDLKEGQWVMAVGHPGGFETARGMVVRIGRIILLTNRVIRTDCTLVGGDSGGPLIDMNGDLIGIHSRIGSKLVENLHVPADVYSMNWDFLAKGIVIDGRPSLGLDVVGKTNEVESVRSEGAAEKAGIKKGDVIVKLGSISIEDSRDILEAISDLNLRPNVVTEIVVLREGEEKKIEIRVGDRMRVENN